jgi:hypothetical protein
MKFDAEEDTHGSINIRSNSELNDTLTIVAKIAAWKPYGKAMMTYVHMNQLNIMNIMILLNQLNQLKLLIQLNQLNQLNSYKNHI